MEKSEAQAYLSSLLNRNLRVYTTDGRLFWGALKCTDLDRNLVLENTYEYRQPSSPRLTEGPDGTTAQDLSSRFLGLIVVPGHHIVKMELEEFASQVRGRQAVSLPNVAV